MTTDKKAPPTTVEAAYETEKNSPELFQLIKQATESIPPLDSDRITFEYEGHYAPDDFSPAYGNYGNYESYEPEYEQDQYVAWIEGYETKNLLIDGVVVYSGDFAVYQSREDDAPEDEEPPTDQQLYDAYCAHRTGALVKAEAIKLAQSMNDEQKEIFYKFMSEVISFYRFNGLGESSLAVQSAMREIRFAGR